MSARAYTLGWPAAATFALILASCSFDTSVLDARRCTSTSDCDEGFFCDEQGICQSELADIIEDVDTGPDLEEPNPCTDFDGDQVFGGEGCHITPHDCNDRDPAVYEGADEVCDLKDNDCDDLVDTDDDNYIVVPCPLQDGVCENSEQACVEGVLQTCTADTYDALAQTLGSFYVQVEEGDEAACDTFDNDCDGEVDEQIFKVCYDLSGVDSGLLTQIGESADCDPLVEGDCVTLQAGRPCQSGLVQCANGNFDGTCEGQVVPTSEETFETRCDTIDNDCDGQNDEDCNCQPGEERACLTPAGDTRTAILELFNCPTDTPPGLANCEPRAPCRVGRQVCGENARFGDCLQEILPVAETCTDPGVDNDCDGDALPTDITSELGPGVTVNVGDACTTTEPGRCAPGTYQCVGGSVVCVRNLDPRPVTCANNGTTEAADDDCDGTRDNIEGRGEPCSVTEFDGDPIYGECQYGMVDCEGTTLICRPAATSGEVCNDLDDDCNNSVDNGVNTTTDANNCGACDNVCSGGTSDCCGGGCMNLDDGVDRADGSIDFCGTCANTCAAIANGDVDCCSGGCVDLDTSEAHCGVCGHNCNAGETCLEGQCYDTQTSEDRCGPVGGSVVACDADTEHCCGGVCVPWDDGADCGTCGNDCTSSQSCRAVVSSDADAVCPTDDASDRCWACKGFSDADFCGPSGANCDQLDAANPGGGTDYDCCDTGAGLSDYTCLDLQRNVNYCGTCAVDCDSGGRTDPACCSGGCSDRAFDEANCGACGNVCASGSQCCGGRCIALGDIGNCGACGNACGTNEGCCDVTATDVGAGGAADGGCVGADCFGCVDLNNGIDRGDTSIAYCGTCGTTVAGAGTPPATCAAGATIDCCSGFCTNLTDNNVHCGSCGNVCDVFGDEQCVGTTCQ